MSLIERLGRQHRPTTPRTHDGQGHKIEEAPQCQQCLQTWACETHQLLSIIEQQAGEIRRLSDERKKVEA